MMGSEMKPCPFCGSRDIEVRSKPIEHKAGRDCPSSVITKVWAVCKYCGAEGSKKVIDAVYRKEFLAAAIVGWNGRSK